MFWQLWKYNIFYTNTEFKFAIYTTATFAFRFYFLFQYCVPGTYYRFAAYKYN